MRRSRAVITVFFSLLSILFLSLMFTCAEASDGGRQLVGILRV